MIRFTLPGFILRGRALRRRRSDFARDHPAALRSAARPRGPWLSTAMRRTEATGELLVGFVGVTSVSTLLACASAISVVAAVARRNDRAQNFQPDSG